MRERSFQAFYYPRTGQWPDGSHHNLVFSLVPELRRPDADVRDPDDLLRELRTELEDVQQDCLLISSEFLSTGCTDQVVAWFVGHGLADPDKILTLLVDRDPISRGASLYNQRVKDPFVGEIRSPAEWLEEEGAGLALVSIQERLRAATTDLLVVPYEPAESLVARLLRAAGVRELDLPKQDEISWVNVSMSQVVLMAMLEINRKTTDPQERLRLRSQLFDSHQPAFGRSSPDIFVCGSCLDRNLDELPRSDEESSMDDC